jgi:ABC-type multidrug transport system fused ATPase/permease subunit
MRAPMGWFERTPMGRILNRFSSDMQEIDKVYIHTLYDNTTLMPVCLHTSVFVAYYHSTPFCAVADCSSDAMLLALLKLCSSSLLFIVSHATGSNGRVWYNISMLLLCAKVRTA